MARKHTTYLEIICPDGSGQQMIRLAQGISRLIDHQQVHMRHAPREEGPGIRLRVYVAEELAKQHWPALRSLLREEELLEQCRGVIADENTAERRVIWPREE